MNSAFNERGKSMSNPSGRSVVRRQSGLEFDEAIEQQPPAELSSDELNHIVARIRRLTRTASLEFALTVGGLIIHHFYEGNTDTWRLRGPKASSFRRLAEHPELPMSPGALYRCVAIFELCDRLGAASRWHNLGASHLRVVLGISPTDQERLLSTANSQRWTVRALQNEVVRSKLTRSTRGGRRPQSKVTRFLKTIRKCLAEHEGALDDVRSANPKELHEIAKLLTKTRASLDSVALKLPDFHHDEGPPSLPANDIECEGIEVH